MRKCAYCYFCSTNAFFALQMKIFWVCSTNFFCALGKNFVCWKKILSAQYKLLPPYGASFAALWHRFCRLMACVLPPYVIFEAQYKSLLHFLGGGCKSLSMDSMLLSKTKHFLLKTYIYPT